MHKDNYICPDPSPTPETDAQILREYPKALGWLPFETYDMVQCGYPLPNHGEMVRRAFGGTNEKGELLPPRGMWVKAEDVRNLVNAANYIIATFKDLNGTECKTGCGKCIKCLLQEALKGKAAVPVIPDPDVNERAKRMAAALRNLLAIAEEQELVGHGNNGRWYIDANGEEIITDNDLNK